MPRFFMHLREEGETFHDREGQEFATEAMALLEAKRGACDVLFDKIRMGEFIDNDELQVVDHAGRIIQTILLRSLIKFKGEY